MKHLDELHRVLASVECALADVRIPQETRVDLDNAHARIIGLFADVLREAERWRRKRQLPACALVNRVSVN